eukprot:jgi/Tetstr1/433043/TSEL_022379.t1
MVVEGNGGGGEGIPLPVVVWYAGGGRVGATLEQEQGGGGEPREGGGWGGAEVRQAGGRGIRAPRAGDELAEGVSEETVSALDGEEQREGMLALERRLAVAVELEECELSYDAVPELVAALHRAVRRTVRRCRRLSPWAIFLRSVNPECDRADGGGDGHDGSRQLVRGDQGVHGDHRARAVVCRG